MLSKWIKAASARRVLAGAKAGYETYQWALAREHPEIGVIPAASWDSVDSTTKTMWIDIADAVLGKP